MFSIRSTIVFLLSLFSTNTFADVYFHLGGGIDYLKHNKSSDNYVLLNAKGGAGYKLTSNIAFEIDLTAKSTTKYTGTGTCTTTLNTVIECNRNEEVSRIMAIGSGIYTRNIGASIAFAKAGIGLVRSTFRSSFDSDLAPTLVLTDEIQNDIAFIVSAGLIRKEKHRIGAIMSTKYGNSAIGKFNFIGIEYNYLFNM